MKSRRHWSGPLPLPSCWPEGDHLRPTWDTPTNGHVRHSGPAAVGTFSGGHAAPVPLMGEAAGRRLLVATGAAVADVSELPPLVRGLLDSASHILVITPILPGRLQWLVSDTDRARHEADERLNVLLGQMEQMGLAAEVRVGDESPLTAFDDAVKTFQPDHILIALRGSEGADWQERGLVDQVRERFDLPITLFEIA